MQVRDYGHQSGLSTHRFHGKPVPRIPESPITWNARWFIFVALLQVCVGAAGQDLNESFVASNDAVARVETGTQWPGELISALDRELTWEVVDLEIPGNGPTIQVGRTYSSYSSPGNKGVFQLFGKWQLSVPQIDVGRWFAPVGVLAGCGDVVSTKNYTVKIPGVSGFREIAQNPSQISYPSGTHTHFENNWILTCEAFATRSNSFDSSGTPLPKNRTDGLTLISPDGTKYRFSYWSEEFITNRNFRRLRPVKNVYTYYISDIEDQWGNYVVFDYETAIVNWGGEKDPVLKLRTMWSSDGRTVDVAYNENSHISSVSYAGRTLAYSYDTSEATFLKTVTYPEGVKWDYTYYPNTGDPYDFKRWELESVTTPQGASINYEYEDYANIAGCRFKTESAKNWVSRRIIQNAGVQYVYDYDTTAAGSIPGYAASVKTTITGPDSRNVYHHGCDVLAAADYGDHVLDNRLITQELFGGPSLSTRLRETAYSWKRIAYTGTYHNSPTWASRTPDRVVVGSVTVDGTYARRNTSFDGFGNAVGATELGDGAARSRSYSYYENTASWVVGVPDDETIGSDHSISRNHNAYGQMTSETINGVTTSTAYSGRLLASRTNARGHTTNFSNHYRGIPRTISYPIGSISRVVDAFGRTTDETNERGFTTSFTYDGVDRLIEIDRPIGHDISVTYAGNSSMTVTAGPYREIRLLDGFNNATQRTLADTELGINRYWNFEYDNEGKRTFASVPSAVSSETRGTDTRYDALGRIVSQLTPAGLTTYEHRSHNQIRVTNPRSHVTASDYQSYGHPDNRMLTRIDQPSASGPIVTVLSKNSAGKLLSVSQGGKTITYGYHPTYEDYVVQETHPGFTIHYGRDGNGNMTSRRVGAGATTNFGYDARDRQTFTDYPSGTNDATLTYDPSGLLTGAFNTNSNWSYGYDQNDNLSTANLTVGSQQLNFTYGRDALNHLSSLAYPDGSLVAYSPNAFGEPTRAGSYASAVTHHPTGALSTFTYGNGLIFSSALDATGLRLLNIVTKNASTNVVSKTYAYDGQNNPTSIVDGVRSGDSVTGLIYDGADRLTAATGSSWGGSARVTASYDLLGNITAMNTPCGPTTYTYNAANYLASTSGCINRTFTYNSFGAVSSNGARSFSYDGAERISSISGDGSSVRYEYDAHGHRVTTSGSAGTEYEAHDRAGRLLWIRESGGVTNKKVYVGNTPIAQERANIKTYTHTDHVNSIVALSSQSKGMTYEHYQPYGTKTFSPKGTNHDQWYAGKRFDPNTGLSYFGARYYDPSIGRFYSNDPAGFSETAPTLFNRYAYANNNPYAYVDETGELPNFVIGAVVGMVADIAVQTLAEGKSFRQIDGGQVLRAGAIGAVSGGASSFSVISRASVGVGTGLRTVAPKVLIGATNGAVAGGVASGTQSALTQLADGRSIDSAKALQDAAYGAGFGMLGGGVFGGYQVHAARNIYGDARGRAVFHSQDAGTKVGAALGVVTGAALAIGNGVREEWQVGAGNESGRNSE